MGRYFSIIIPTLFRCQSILNKLLETLYEDMAVSEVILINNTDSLEIPDTIKLHDKTKVCSVGKNMYVNPSWNYGVSTAKENYIAILNDDITIPNSLFSILSQANIESLGIIGACHPMIQQVESPNRFDIDNLQLSPVPERMWGYGIAMIMHKDSYVEIPEDMLIWCGDDYLFHETKRTGRQNYVLMCPIQTKMSVTSDDPIFDDIKSKDLEAYNLKYKI